MEFNRNSITKIRNGNNQVPHLTWDTICESDKNTIKNTTHKRAKRPTGDHKAVRNRQDSITKTNINNKTDPQKKQPLGKVSKKTVELKHVDKYQPPLNSDVDQDR